MAIGEARTARLFVALAIPEDVGDALCALAPPAGGGVRVVTRDLLHVTLHFRGMAEVDRVVAALATVEARPFALTLAGVGQFPTRDGEVALWVGVQPNDGLTALHAAAGEALRCETWGPEGRPFTPHVTLARCKRRVPREVIDAFAARGGGFGAVLDVRAFALFVSTQGPSGPIYAVEHTFPLGAP